MSRALRCHLCSRIMGSSSSRILRRTYFTGRMQQRFGMPVFGIMPDFSGISTSLLAPRTTSTVRETGSISCFPPHGEEFIGTQRSLRSTARGLSCLRNPLDNGVSLPTGGARPTGGTGRRSDDRGRGPEGLVATDPERPSNQSMKPTAPFRCNPSVFVTTLCPGLSLSR